MIPATFPQPGRADMALARRIVLMLAAAMALLAEPVQAGAPDKADFAAIAKAAEDEIAVGNIPGAVILIGSHDTLLYRGVFGHRTLGKTPMPMPMPMSADTIFDLASLTKVVATTTAIMQLAEAGKIDLAAPVSRYWPAFTQVDGGAITISDLLTHHSGLRADIDLSKSWTGHRTAMKMILAQRPRIQPRTPYLYSDINFEILGEIVHRVSGQALDLYCRDHVFAPLGMKSSFFRPPQALRNRIAPTAGGSGKVYWGVVHDAT
ncbi:MAG: beta-lactamase family protein, partial [Alphaproteobacteria bacterium]|nr:beta-lactamase family protein [Alphaproteobacteria bacterium]